MGFTAQLDALPNEAETPAEKLRSALELYDAGVALQRLNLARQHPGITGAELDVLVATWLSRELESQQG